MEDKKRSQPLTQEKITDLHKILCKYFDENEFSVEQALGFLCMTFIGTMALNGYSDQFFDATVERMKLQFREKKDKFMGNNE